MLPNWIIVGAPKSGTSSLFRWVTDHPEAAGSLEKETYYFVDPGTHMYHARSHWETGGLKGYEALFAHCAPGSRVVMESTPGYMYSETALRELPDLPSRPQFIFILREPVEQLKSLYSYFRENWAWIPHAMSFRDFVVAAEQGTCAFNGNELAACALTNASYVEHLRRWRARCGDDRIHIYLFENMVRDQRSFMASLAGRLGLSAGFYDDYEFPAENVTYSVRSRLVQNVNIRVRAAIPKGFLYNVLRGIYRAFNTGPTSRSPIADLEMEQVLSRRYLDMVRALELEFGLDTSAWHERIAARFADQATLVMQTPARTLEPGRPEAPATGQ